MKIVPFYKSILKVAGMRADEEGFISTVGKTSDPVLVKGKRLVLPVEPQMKNTDWTNRVAFHPLCEDITKGESDVLAVYRKRLVSNLNITLLTLAVELLKLNCSTATHSGLTPEQSEFLSFTKEADDKTVAAFKSIISATVPNNTNTFFTLYLKKGGVLDGKSYARLGVVTFPIYNELLKNEADKTCFGVKLRAKDYKALKGLFEYMIPNIAEPDSYNQGSHGTTAPFLDALMKTVMGIGSVINGLIGIFGKVFTDDDQANEMLVEGDWVDVFVNLKVMEPEIRNLPMLVGNDGSVDMVPVPPQPIVTPVQTVNPNIPPWMQSQIPQQPPQQQSPYMPVGPANMMQQPQVKPAMDDVLSIIRSNPALQQNFMNPQQGYMGGMQQPQQFIPSWMQQTYQAPNTMMGYQPFQQQPMMQQQPMGQGSILGNYPGMMPNNNGYFR